VAAAMPRATLLNLIRVVASEEAAHDADDFLERRTNWPFTAREPDRLRAIVEEALGSGGACSREVEPKRAR
jgi:hypothetical protein